MRDFIALQFFCLSGFIILASLITIGRIVVDRVIDGDEE